MCPNLGSKKDYDFVITEIGGTVGDIESLPYIEAVRQMKWESPEDTLAVHLTLVPYLSAAGELKTKPTQHSVKQLLEFGVQADILVCRTEHPLPANVRTKLARFCNVGTDAVIESIDADSIYDVPLLMQEEKFDEVVLRKLGMDSADTSANLHEWRDFLHRYKNPLRSIKVGLVGKYVELKDSYKSIAEALDHAGAKLETSIDLDWIHSEQLTATTSLHASQASTPFWWRLALVPVASTANCLLWNTPAPQARPSLAFASECNVRWWNLPATSCTLRRRTPQKSRNTPPTLSST